MALILNMKKHPVHSSPSVARLNCDSQFSIARARCKAADGASKSKCLPVGCRYRTALFVFLCAGLTSSLLLMGCKAMATKDKLPDGAPKGYVEFYYLPIEGNPGYRVWVYSKLSLGTELYEGLTGAWDQNPEKRVGLRIAKRPGRYRFALRLERDSSEEIDVRVLVEEGKITPVKIHFTDVNKTVNSGVPQLQMSGRHSGVLTTSIETTTSFKMSCSVEKAQPIPAKK